MECCSVFVASCDKYEDAWYPFFSLLSKYWDKCPYKIYLSTETKKCNIANVITINDKNNPSGLWGKRIKNALKAIDSEYIIFLLEDFFIMSGVRQEEIDKCIKYLDEDRDISVFCFEKIRNWKYIDDNKYNGFHLRDDKPSFYLNCQAAIWRRNDLIKYINIYESPWQFEEFGSVRAKLYGKKFYTYALNENAIFNYEFDLKKGYGIHRGWLRGNVDLFKKENIDVNFMNLGFYEPSSADNQDCIAPPKIDFRWRVAFFLYGGSKRRITPSQLCKLLFVKPKAAISIIKNRIQFVLSRSAPMHQSISRMR